MSVYPNKKKNKKIKLDIKKNLLMFVDVETIGFPTKNPGKNKYHPYTDNSKYNSSRLVSIAWTIHDFKNNKIQECHYIINPIGFIINNSHIHGITHDNATKDGVLIDGVFDNLKNSLKNVKFVIAHNIQFDIHVIYNELHRKNRYDIINILEEKEQLCTGEMTKNILKIPFNSTYISSDYKIPSLQELYKYCFDKNLENHHNADEDVKHLSEAFFYILNN
jgi:DNA polymerase III epsilon subunit-like protein